ncbi:MAG: hypothetical protein V4494_07340 [Chlamydiota bacterium]
MSLHSLPISRAEKWNRIIWTILAAGFNLFIPLCGLIVFIVACFQLQIYTAFWAASVSILSIIPSWMIWHCIYKKHGTKLLMFLIFAGPCLAILYAIAAIFKPELHLAYLNFASQITPWMILTQAPFSTCWLIMSWELLRTNKKLYMQKHCTNEYLAALEQMNASTSTDELTAHFNTLMLQWPKLKRHFTRGYKAKKRTLQ